MFDKRRNLIVPPGPLISDAAHDISRPRGPRPGGLSVVPRLTAGYGVPDGYRLPPLSLTPRKATALRLGAQFIRIQTDATLTAAADSALAKIEGTLPPAVRAPAKALATAVKWRRRERHRSRPGPGVLLALQQAIAMRKAARISYAGGSRLASSLRYAIGRSPRTDVE